MKTFDRKFILRLLLPSAFFVVLLVLGAFGSPFWGVHLVTGTLILLILVNVFIKNIILSRVMGAVFLIGTGFMWLALLSDVINGKATLGYLVGVLLLLLSMFMAVSLVIGYEKPEVVTGN